jgi:hypothetical protein
MTTMNAAIPKNGPMAGMIVPALTAALVLPIALLSPAFRSHFASPLSTAMQVAFFASVVLMVLHKVESFWFGEYDQCPVYVTQANSGFAGNPRKAQFLTFVPTFLGMLMFAFLAFLGPPWHLITLTVWLGQGLHELHHLAKSAARGRAYPGIVTSILFVAVMSFALFPMWHDAVIGARGVIFYAYYALMPLVFLGHYFEDKKWIAAAPEAIWNPNAETLVENPGAVR